MWGVVFYQVMLLLLLSFSQYWSTNMHHSSLGQCSYLIVFIISPGHVAEDPGDDADDGEGDPEGAQGVGDHHKADQHHEAGRDQDALDGLGLDLQVLVNVDEERVEHSDLKYSLIY